MIHTGGKQAGHSLIGVLVSIAVLGGFSLIIAKKVKQIEQISRPIAYSAKIMDMQHYIHENFDCEQTITNASCSDIATFVTTFDKKGRALTDAGSTEFGDTPLKASCVNNTYNFVYESLNGDWKSLFDDIPIVCPLPSSVELAQACDLKDTEIVSYETTIDFPARADCDWNDPSKGNLDLRQGYIQAREVQTFNVPPLPEGAVLCDFHLKSTSNDWHYDDFAIFTLNDAILALTNKSIKKNLSPLETSEELETDAEIFKWDWDLVRGFHIEGNGGFDVSGECPESKEKGKKSVCKLPSHDKKGKVEIKPEKAIMQSLAVYLMEKREPLKLDMIITGDNDVDTGGMLNDCAHTGIGFDLKIDYYIK